MKYTYNTSSTIYVIYKMTSPHDGMHAFFLLIFIFPEASSVRFFLSPSFFFFFFCATTTTTTTAETDAKAPRSV